MRPIEFALLFLAHTMARGLLWLALVSIAAFALRHASAAARVLVWRAGFVGLAAIPLLLFVLPGIPILRSDVPPASSRRPEPPVAALGKESEAPVTPPRAQAHQAEDARSATAANQNPRAGIARTAMAESSPEQTVSSTLPATSLLTDIHIAVAAIWAAGLVWVLASLAASGLALIRVSRSTIDPPVLLVTEMNGLARDLGLRRRIRVRIAAPDSGIRAPITWGAIRPVIVLPADYADRAITELRAALLHELAHIKQCDWPWLMFAQLVCGLYWCLPFSWLAALQLRCESEMLCDDYVLSNGVAAPEYAALILQIARRMSETRAELPCGALGMARPPLAQMRIQAVLDGSRRRGAICPSAVVGMALVACVAATALSLRAVAAITRREVGIVKPDAPESSNPSSQQLIPLLDPAPAAAASERLAPHLKTREMTSALHASRPNTGRLVKIMSTNADDRTTAISVKEANSGKIFRADSAKVRQLSNTQIHWGAPQNGLQVGLAIEGDQKVFSVGDTIVMHAYWRNASKKPIDFAYAWYAKYEMLEEVQTASGGHVEVQGTMIDIPPVKTSASLKPGEAVWAASPEMILKRDADWSVDPTAIVRPGKYRIRIVNFVAPWEGTPPTNTVPSKTQPYSDWIPFQVVERAADNASGIWQVNSLPGLGQVFRGSTAGLLWASVPPVIPARHNLIPDLANAPIKWGPVQSGMQAGLIDAENKQHYRFGERVHLVVVLRNLTSAPISVWHETGSAYLSLTEITGPAGKTVRLAPAPENQTGALAEIVMSNGSMEISYGSSGSGPWHFHRSTIRPGGLLGYFLTAFVVPARIGNRRSVPGSYNVVQPAPVGLGDTGHLDTSLTTGRLTLQFGEPDVRK